MCCAILRSRHCEKRLRRSNPSRRGCGPMDCFASLAMTRDMHARSRDMICPRFAVRSAALNLEGAGKAGCRSHPWVPCNKKHGGRTTGVTGNSGFPCAMVLRLTSCSPRRDRACLSPSPARCVGVSQAFRLPQGRQVHTTSPSVVHALVSRAHHGHRISPQHS